jgi:hypothetical protein
MPKLHCGNRRGHPSPRPQRDRTRQHHREAVAHRTAGRLRLATNIQGVLLPTARPGGAGQVSTPLVGAIDFSRSSGDHVLHRGRHLRRQSDTVSSVKSHDNSSARVPRPSKPIVLLGFGSSAESRDLLSLPLITGPHRAGHDHVGTNGRQTEDQRPLKTSANYR